MATEKFHHTTPHGDVTLPHFKHLPFGTIRKIRKADDAEALFLLVEEVADKKSLAIIDRCDMEQVGTMFEEWQKASGVTVGESSASPSS